MTAETPLDAALAAMNAAPEDTPARLRFFDRLAGSEVFVMLHEEAQGESISPEIFGLDEGQFVVAFDREDRLAGFAGQAVPYAAMSGRALAALLAPRGIGLALNPGQPAAQILLPPEAVTWLADVLARPPAEADARLRAVHAPTGLHAPVLQALDGKLASAAGLARQAYLVLAQYETGATGHLLGITGALPGAAPALASAIQEALVFSGLDAAALDVAFLRDDDPLAAEMARVGLRFDLPQPDAPRVREALAAPGSDPEKPPILR